MTAKLHHPLDDCKEFVGHVADGQVYPGGGFHYGALVRESVKTELAVIVTHSGVAYTAKRDVTVGYVHDGVVDASAA